MASGGGLGIGSGSAGGGCALATEASLGFGSRGTLLATERNGPRTAGSVAAGLAAGAGGGLAIEIEPGTSDRDGSVSVDGLKEGGGDAEDGSLALGWMMVLMVGSGKVVGRGKSDAVSTFALCGPVVLAGGNGEGTSGTRIFIA